MIKYLCGQCKRVSCVQDAGCECGWLFLRPIDVNDDRVLRARRLLRDCGW